MDYTTLSIPPEVGMVAEPSAVRSLHEALHQLSDPRRGQGKRYELALILCLLITLIWPLMARPYGPPRRSLMRCIRSVVMRSLLALSYGIAMCRRKRMKSVRLSRC